MKRFGFLFIAALIVGMLSSQLFADPGGAGRDQRFKDRGKKRCCRVHSMKGKFSRKSLHKAPLLSRMRQDRFTRRPVSMGRRPAAWKRFAVQRWQGGRLGWRGDGPMGRKVQGSRGMYWRRVPAARRWAPHVPGLWRRSQAGKDLNLREKNQPDMKKKEKKDQKNRQEMKRRKSA